jgi:siroheme synthase
MASGTFTVSGTDYTFEVTSEEVGEESASDVNVQRIYGGDTSYVDLGGQTLTSRTVGLYFALAADFAALKGVRGRQGTLVTTRDGTETAVLQTIRRTKRNWDGITEGTATFLITG